MISPGLTDELRVSMMGLTFVGGWVNCWQLRQSYPVVMANALLKRVFYSKFAVKLT